MPKTADAEKNAAKGAASKSPVAKQGTAKSAAPKEAGAKVVEKKAPGGKVKAASAKDGEGANAKAAKQAAPPKAAATKAPLLKPAVAKPAVTKPPMAKSPAKPAPKPVLTKIVPVKGGSGKGETTRIIVRPNEPSVTNNPSLDLRPIERPANGVNSIVWGPLESKRFGRTLVVNLSAPRTAMTARRGLSIPRASLIVTTVAREIILLAREAVKVDTIAVVGTETDPCGHPDLREITENLRALRDKHLSRAKLRVLTAVRDLASYELRSTLAMYDRLHLQFEWGTSKVFSAVTGEKPTQLTSLIKQASNFDHLVIDANFFKGPDDRDNSSDSEVKNWIRKLQEVKPQEVHILPGSGSAAKAAKTKPVPQSRRDEIAEEVAERTGLNVTVHEEDALLV
jgi:hypothetical protein